MAYAFSLAVNRLLISLCLLAACGSSADPTENASAGGKADDPFVFERDYEVILTAPFCDECESADKDLLLERSRIMARVVELIDGAEESIDVAQFTFSRRTIEEALLRAHERGVDVRIAMDHKQELGDNVSNRLKDAGVPVRFVKGKVLSPERAGLQHAKFMVVDDRFLLTGSNNWSSTGVSINNENTMVMDTTEEDPLLSGFQCHFQAMWDSKLDEAGACSNDVVAFTPSTRPIRMLKDEIRGARHSIDVLMHHLLFDDLVKELTKAAKKPEVTVRIVVNDGDQNEHTGSKWDALREAGVEIRYKKRNADAFQIMHHKLVIIDDVTLINGSGNWSGSAFFNNYENFIRYVNPAVVGEFRQAFTRLWDWSLTVESLAAGRTAAEQHVLSNETYFGNLHAHFSAEGLDDGTAQRAGEEGTMIPVAMGDTVAESSRFAYEYARDQGGMDFLMLSPHTTDDRDDDPADISSMSREGYAEMLSTAGAVSRESTDTFVAMAGMEWNTNSLGNHVNVIGSSQVAKTERGRFDEFYREFLPGRSIQGDIPVVQMNHPRTFRKHLDALNGSWDQIFGVPLTDISRNGERTKKFNDFGLDDFEPLASVWSSWIDGTAMPDEAVVAETLQNIARESKPYLRLMEVTLGRGKEIAHENGQNPNLTTDLETGEEVRVTKVHEDFDYYLLHGFRLAPTAPHDNHNANWGTGHSSRTGVIAQTLSERALVKAMDARATFASEDQNLELRFYAGGRVPMGGEFGTRESQVTLSYFLSDIDHDGAYEVRVYQGTVGGEAVTEVLRMTDATADALTEFSLDLPEAGTHFVYLEILQVETNRMAWSAPIWINR